MDPINWYFMRTGTVQTGQMMSHGGESRDFTGLKMADTYQNFLIQVRISLIFSLIQIRLAWGLKQKPQKNDSNMSILATFRQRSG